VCGGPCHHGIARPSLDCKWKRRPPNMKCSYQYCEETLKQKYQEHVRYIKHNNPQSAYAIHSVNNLHKYGPMNSSMCLLKRVKKGTYLNSIEHFYIPFYTYKNKLISNECIGERDPLYQCFVSQTLLLADGFRHRKITPYPHVPTRINIVSGLYVSKIRNCIS
jgi:hypothetical protein